MSAGPPFYRDRVRCGPRGVQYIEACQACGSFRCGGADGGTLHRNWDRSLTEEAMKDELKVFREFCGYECGAVGWVPPSVHE